MYSKLYICEVVHARLWPVRHAFRYPLYVYAVDVDELPALDREIPLFGYNRVRLASLHDGDYLEVGSAPIREKVVKCLRDHGVDIPVARIMLVTAARFLNYVFNPVSFFYCYGSDDALIAIIAYVTNTFGESHLYVLDEPLAPRGGATHYRAEKAFHVSPFFDVSGHYEFFFSSLEEDLNIVLQLHRENGRVFVARLRGKARPLTNAALLRTVARYPLTAVISFPRILWEALQLHYRRKLPVFRKPCPESPDTIRFASPKLSRRLAKRAVLHRLQRLQTGRLDLMLPDRSVRTFGEPEGTPHRAVHVRNDDFFWRLATAGDTGMGEAYMAGDFTCDDLTGVLELLVRNMNHLRTDGRFAQVPRRIADRLQHLTRANTLAGSRANIGAHYDLNNDFFRLFLDPSMSYSCALYTHPGQPLAEAQQNKLRSIIAKAGIEADDHVLEIGCGWGGFALAAAAETGCRVTGITVSDHQFELATERVRAAGLSDRIDIQLCDYRHVQGHFDKVVSIEMLEAVGHRYFNTFFRTLDRVLAPGGRAVLQVITIPDQRYEHYRRSSDWINRHIFPGGHLPSLTALCNAATRSSHLLVDHIENIGDHYAPTLRAWRERFLANAEPIRRLGFDDIFLRTWEYYFSYCEAGFATRILNDLHLVLRRAGE